MADLIIFNSPELLLGFGAALFFCLFDRIYKASGYLFPALSLVIFLITASASLLEGASMEELCLPVFIFLGINLSMYERRAS